MKIKYIITGYINDCDISKETSNFIYFTVRNGKGESGLIKHRLHKPTGKVQAGTIWHILPDVEIIK